MVDGSWLAAPGSWLMSHGLASGLGGALAPGLDRSVRILLVERKGGAPPGPGAGPASLGHEP